MKKTNDNICFERSFNELFKGYALEVAISSPCLLLPFKSWRWLFLVVPIYIVLFLIHLWKYHPKGSLLINDYGIIVVKKQNLGFPKQQILWNDVIQVLYRIDNNVGSDVVICQYLDITYRRRDRNGFVLQKSTQKTTICVNDYLSYFEQDICYTRFFRWIKSFLFNTSFSREDSPVLTYDKNIDACLRQYCELYDIAYSLVRRNS